VGRGCSGKSCLQVAHGWNAPSAPRHVNEPGQRHECVSARVARLKVDLCRVVDCLALDLGTDAVGLERRVFDLRHSKELSSGLDG
jgi:hypothetical protein